LLFFDETSVNLSMARRYARAEGGARALGFVPKNWGESTTLVAGIGLRGLVAPMVMPGSLNGEVFDSYIEQFVVPVLMPGDVVILDNLSAHKREKVQNLVASVGRLVFIPPYSPDLNPIELCWSKLKTLLRTRKPRTVDELTDAIADSIEHITTSDLTSWIRHCGYGQ
jgi:transposase